MANPIFVYQDLTGVLITASSGEATGYPRSNLLTYFAADTWVSGDTADAQTLNMTLTSAIAGIDSLCLEYTNFISCGCSSITLEAADNSGFTVGKVSGIVDVKSASAGQYYFTFTPQTKQYWRLLFTKGSTLLAAPSCGNMFLGNRLDFGTPYNYEFENTNLSFNTVEKVALDGSLRMAQSYGGRQTFLLKFTEGNALTDAVKTEFQTFFGTVDGKLRPFYFIDTDSSIHYVHLDLDKDPTLVKRYNLNEVRQIPLKSQLTF
jgi:hypothetical protein